MSAELRKTLFSFYNSCTDYYPDWIERQRIRAILTSMPRSVSQVLNGVRGRLVLDCGCGAGKFTALLSSLGALTVGIDISKRGILAGKTSTEGDDNVQLVLADAQFLPFRDDCFDISFCLGVLEHLPRPWVCLGNLAMSTKREGLIIVSFPNVASATLPTPSLKDIKRYAKNAVHFAAQWLEFALQIPISGRVVLPKCAVNGKWSQPDEDIVYQGITGFELIQTCRRLGLRITYYTTHSNYRSKSRVRNQAFRAIDTAPIIRHSGGYCQAIISKA